MKDNLIKNIYHHQLIHWWHRSKREILSYIIKDYLKKKMKVLDYGCGAGNNLNIFSNVKTLHAYEKSNLAKTLIKKKNVKIVNKLDTDYDIILCSDVLEHIKDDKLIIDIFHNSLKKNGLLFLTVPALPILYTNKDKELGHYRRYKMKDLKKLFKNFKIQYLSYYNFFLFFLIAPVLIFMNKFNISIAKKVESSPNLFLNNLFYRIFSLEKFFLKRKTNFPIGISIIGILKK